MALNDTTALNMRCLGEFGGPVEPWVALGGFPGIIAGNLGTKVEN